MPDVTWGVLVHVVILLMKERGILVLEKVAGVQVLIKLSILHRGTARKRLCTRQQAARLPSAVKLRPQNQPEGHSTYPFVHSTI